MIVTSAGAARRRGGFYPLPPATETPPYGPVALCTIATPDGQGQTIHPSVVDMVAERGSPLGGFRWWMANTPWTDKQDVTENPIIVASNDRVTWVAPPGLSNPIEPWDEIAGNYNSDTELVWDPVEQHLVCLWRWVSTSLGVTEMRAKTSADGVTWSPTALVLTPSPISPGITRRPDGGWLMIHYLGWGVSRADSPLGPWVPQAGGQRPAGIADNPYHGSVDYIAGQYIALFSDATIPKGGPSLMYVARSPDGYTWTPVTQIPGNGIIGDVGGSVYRPILAASTSPGWVDVWCSTTAMVPGSSHGQNVVYTRFPLSALPA